MTENNFNEQPQREPENDNNGLEIQPDNEPLQEVKVDLVDGDKTVVEGNYINNLTVGGNAYIEDKVANVFITPEQRNFSKINSPTRYFTGRISELDQIASNFQKDSIGVITQTISGLGGIGKTQTALKFAEVNKERYNHQFLINATDALTLASNLANIAIDLELATLDTPAEQRLAMVRNWFNKNTDWLLILDNADDINPSDVKEIINFSSTGNVLITSRRRDWEGLGEVTKLGILSDDEAIDLLESITDIEDRKNSLELIEELGHLPLALAQSASYIRNRKELGVTYETYLNEFKNKRAELWGKEKKVLDYHETVATTWELSMVQILEESEGAYELMQILSFFAPEDIPLWVFKEGREKLSETTQSEELVEILTVLSNYSMIDVEEGLISIHKLVQSVVREGMGEEAVQKVLKETIQTVWKVNKFDDKDPSTWRKAEELLPHIVSVSDYGEARNVELKLVSRLLDYPVGGYLRVVSAEYERSKRITGRALEIKKAVYGEQHPEVAGTYGNLGIVQIILGEYEEAKQSQLKALEILIAVYGEQNPEVAITYGNLGNVQQNLGEYEEAKQSQLRALEIEKAVYGEQHPSVASTYGNLGIVQQNLGEYEEAKQSLLRALEINIAVYGNNHPDVASTYGNLGIVQLNLGEYEEAKQSQLKALEIHKAVYGEQHPYVASTYGNLGNVQSILGGEYEEAKQSQLRALEINIAVYGEQHPEVAIIYGNLGNVQRVLEEYEEAKQSQQRALEINIAVYGEQHPEVAIIYGNLGIVQRVLGEYEEAMTNMKKSLQIFEATLGANHPHTQQARGNLERISNRSSTKRKSFFQRLRKLFKN